jgi:DNA-binding transcriptional MerR regulator
MSTLLTIGEFSRLTHVSVKALRHYHDVGLLAPAETDGDTGYRFYATAQAPTALLIRRFREMDMPLEQIKAVLGASSPAERDRVIIAHLQSMERQLEHTQVTVASLRALLQGGEPATAIEVRTLGSTQAFVTTDRVAWDDAQEWLGETLVALRRQLNDAMAVRSGPDGALYSEEFFEAHVGPVTAFLPISAAVPDSTELAGGPVAVTVHEGPFEELDRVYTMLGTVVAERGIGVSGPIRENYLIGMLEASDDEALVTEVCWPTIRVPS